jgi:hypothetical protein
MDCVGSSNKKHTMRSHGSYHAARSVHNGRHNVYTEGQNNSLRLGCKCIFVVEKFVRRQRNYFLKTCVSKINPDKSRTNSRGNCTHCHFGIMNHAGFQPDFKTSFNEAFPLCNKMKIYSLPLIVHNYLRY